MLKHPMLVAGVGPEVVCVCWKVDELKRVASYLSWSCRCWRKVTTGRGQGSGGTAVGGWLGRGCGGQELREVDHSGLQHKEHPPDRERDLS